MQFVFKFSLFILVLNIDKLDWDPHDTIIKMAFIKEESEDMRIEETFRIKHEDTEEQTGWFSFSKLNSLI